MAKKITNNIDKVSKNVFVLAEGLEETPYLWDNMPEFISVDVEPYATIDVYVRSKEDMDKLGKLMEQEFTEKTKFTWYPTRDRWRNSDLRCFGKKD